jgi:uncharacterized membrane protein YgcG
MYISIYCFKFLKGTGQLIKPIVIEGERKVVVDSEDDNIPISFITPGALSTRMFSLYSEKPKSIITPFNIKDHTIMLRSNQTLTVNLALVSGSRSGIIGNNQINVKNLVVQEDSVSSFRSTSIDTMILMQNSKSFIDCETTASLLAINLEKKESIPFVEFGSDLSSMYKIGIVSTNLDIDKEFTEYQMFARINEKSKVTFEFENTTKIGEKEFNYSIKRENNCLFVKMIGSESETGGTDTSTGSSSSTGSGGGSESGDGSDSRDGSDSGNVAVIVVCSVLGAIILIGAVVAAVILLRKPKAEVETDELMYAIKV